MLLRASSLHISVTHRRQSGYRLPKFRQSLSGRSPLPDCPGASIRIFGEAGRVLKCGKNRSLRIFRKLFLYPG